MVVGKKSEFMGELKQKTVRGLIWSGLERFSVQGVFFLVQIVMARILLPEYYGLVGMITVFLAISQVFIDSGFSNALIRKQDRTEVDYSTVFYFNVVIGVLLYLILYFTSPLIAKFYDRDVLEQMIKILAIILVINSLTVVQRARLTIDIDFKTQTKASFLAITVSGVVGILMAYNGYGVWSLVAQVVINGLINMVMLWIYSRWLPLIAFSFKSFKEMFSFGSKLLLSSLIDTLYKNLFILIIGKKFDDKSLGFYTRADQFAQFPSSNLTGIMSRVTFPILSSIQDDEERLGVIYIKYLKMAAFVIFPLMVGLAALAHPLIIVILKPQWEGAVVLLQILCFSAMLYPIHAINLNLLQVKGRSDLFLKLEIIKKIIGLVILFITVPMGVIAMCIGGVFTSFITLIINTYYTGRLINEGFIKQVKCLLPIFGCSLSMGFFIFVVLKFVDSNILSLLLGTILGMVYYFFIAYLSRSNELNEIISLLLQLKNRKI